MSKIVNTRILEFYVIFESIDHIKIKVEIQMRKAARKQKKLEKLTQTANNSALQSENNPTTIFPANTDVLRVVMELTEKSKIEGNYVNLNEKDYELFTQYLANNSTIKSLTCEAHIKIINPITEALKTNKSVQALLLQFYSSNAGADLTNILNRLGDMLQHNTTLAQLSLANLRDGSYTTTDPSFDRFINGIKNSKSLTKLSIPSLSYKPEHMSALLEAINGNTNIKNLIFPEFGICSSEAMKSVGILVKYNLLKKLNLIERRSRSGTELLPLFEALKENTSLTDLQFPTRSSFISKIECEALAEVLKVHQSLTKLNLNGNGLGSDSTSIILDSLQHNTTLTDLKFWDNNLNNDICSSLGSLLSVNESLTQIDLPKSSINAEGCKLIGLALKKNRSITELSMFMNPFGAEGCKYLAEGLKFNKTLIRVKISDCQINDEACQYLAEAIKYNPCLLRLDISGMPIKTKGYKALIEGMKENDSLTDLTVSKDRSVPSELHDEIVTIQNRNRQYQRELKVTTITMLIQIARSDAFDMFPLEIWLRIFKHFVCGGVPGFNHIAESILMHSDVRDLTSLCKMRIVRIKGKSHLVQKNINK